MHELDEISGIHLPYVTPPETYREEAAHAERATPA